VHPNGAALEQVFRDTAKPEHLDDLLATFEVMGAVQVGAAPLLTPMLRRPRPSERVGSRRKQSEVRP
jgi:hypothetical protein